MKMNKKGISPLVTTVLIIAFTVALACIVMTWGGSFMRQQKEEINEELLFDKSYTTAICNYETNKCIDVLIKCKKSEIVSITPISDLIYMGSNWNDTRNETERFKYC